VIPRYLNSVTSSRGVLSYVNVEIAELPLLKKTMTCFVIVELEPFERCIVIEFV